MNDTHPIAIDAKTNNPIKKISMARSMALVYDAQDLKDHGSTCG
jgi:hypothetical protein